MCAAAACLQSSTHKQLGLDKARPSLQKLQPLATLNLPSVWRTGALAAHSNRTCISAEIQLLQHAAVACEHVVLRRSRPESQILPSPTQQVAASMLRCELQLRTFAARRARNAKRHHRSLSQTVHLSTGNANASRERLMRQALILSGASSVRLATCRAPRVTSPAG